LSVGGIDKFIDYISFSDNPIDENLSFSLLETISILRNVSKLLITTNLSQKQFELLLTLRENEGLLYYQVVQSISSEQGIPASTVRWNLNKLRNADLVIAGDKDNKGIPMQLTSSGRLIASLYEESKISK
jgi:DNA-binding MarR family transcriptional regulator